MAASIDRDRRGQYHNWWSWIKMHRDEWSLVRAPCRKVPRYKPENAKTLGLKFSATLTECGTEWIELARA